MQHPVLAADCGVAIISPGGISGRGGMVSVTDIICQELRRRTPGRRVVILDPRGAGSVWLWPCFFTWSVLRLVVLRATGQVQLLHLQVSERSSFIRKGLLLVIGRCMGMRIVLHHHGAELISFYRSAPLPLRAWASWISGRADINIVLGEKWKTFLIEEVAVQPDRILVIYNAVQGGRGAAPDAITVKRGRVPFHFVFLGHLIPRKGVDQLLTAMSRLRRRDVRFRVTLAGHGEIKRYQEMAQALSIADICTFTGWMPARSVDGLLRTADALVLPSLEEGLPMAILEGLSHAVPVIATPVGSIGEVLSDGVDSLLVAPGDPVALAEAMGRLACDMNLCRALGEAGHALFIRQFTVAAFISKLLDAYKLAFSYSRPVRSKAWIANSPPSGARDRAYIEGNHSRSSGHLHFD